MSPIKLAIMTCLTVALTMPVLAEPRSVSVKAHTRSDGTYVPAHQRTTPNGTRNDNWTTTGNQNPYTGEHGTRPRGADSRQADYVGMPLRVEHHPCEGRRVGGVAGADSGFCLLH